MADSLLRLQKYMADCGLMSRRAAEQKITEGLVTVNGQPAVLGQKIDPSRDTVLYMGEPVAPDKSCEKLYLLLNKPRGYVCTLSDEKGRRTVTDLLFGIDARVWPVGRLDMDSDGLLILTNDGDLTFRLTHPVHEIPKTYRVTVKEDVGEDQLAVLRSPLTLDGYTIRPVDVRLLDRTVLEMVLYEGRNRQIRKMCEAASLSILSLTRTAIGNILIKDLPVGKYRFLSEAELRSLNPIG